MGTYGLCYRYRMGEGRSITGHAKDEQTSCDSLFAHSPDISQSIFYASTFFSSTLIYPNDAYSYPGVCRTGRTWLDHDSNLVTSRLGLCFFAQRQC